MAILSDRRSMRAQVETKTGAVPSIASDEHVHSAGLGQIVSSGNQDDVLVAYGLGSCVGIVGYDASAKVGALLHALLPKYREGDTNRAKFVDSGIPLLLKEMEKLGAKKYNTTWYLVGGAEMLKMPGLGNEFNIGAKNAEMAKLIMEQERMPIKAMDIGGSAGRTVKLLIRDGSVTVRTLGQGEKKL